MSKFNSKLDYFLGQPVSVYTNIIVEMGNDEEGNSIQGRQAYVGWLLDHDDTWVILGEFIEDKGYANAAIKVSEIVHIEFKSEENLEDLLIPTPESSNLN